MKKEGIRIKERDLLYKPPGFFISIDNEWEEWCSGNDFGNSDGVICDVYLKPNLEFLHVKTIEDANELSRILLPGIDSYHPFLVDFGYAPSDMMSFTQYQINECKKGRTIKPRDIWVKILENYDGVCYEYSSDLHLRTFFNTWDVSCIVLFDPENIVSLVMN